MKVLFLKLVPNVGHVGEVKEVSDSYARNFLIPKGFVKKLLPHEEKQFLQQQKQQEEVRRSNLENKHTIIEQLDGKSMAFSEKVQENGKMFGGIKEHDIISKVAKVFQIHLEKKNIYMPDGHIKKAGKHIIYIKFGDNMAKMYINV